MFITSDMQNMHKINSFSTNHVKMKSVYCEQELTINNQILFLLLYYKIAWCDLSRASY